jgi:hypothetical protein
MNAGITTPAWLRTPMAFFWASCALALGLRLFAYWGVDIWQDEANEVFIVEGSWAEAWERMRMSEMRPPLRYVFLKLWLLGGAGAEYLRFPSLVFSSLSVGLLYLGARRLLREDVARWGAVLMAVASFPLSSAYFSRSYAMDMFVTVVAFHAFARLTTDGSRSNRVYYVAALTLTLYTSYFAALVPLLMGAWHLVEVTRRKLDARSLLTLYAPVLVLGAPLLVLLVEQWTQVRTHQWHGEGPGPVVLHLYFDVLASGRIKNWSLTPERALVGVVCWGIAAIGAWQVLRQDSFVASRAEARVVALWFLIPPFAIFCFSLFSIGVFTIRVMLVYAPAYYLLLAAGLVGFRKPALSAAFVACFAAVNLYVFHTTDDLRYITNGSAEVARRIQDDPRSDQKVVHAQHFTYFPIRLYAPNLDQQILQSEVPWNWGAAQIPREDLSTRFSPIRGEEGFWFVQQRNRYKQDRRRWLEQLRTLTSSWLGPDGQRYSFVRDDRILTEAVALTHYVRRPDDRRVMENHRLRSELESQIEDGVYPDPQDAAWIRETLMAMAGRPLAR